MVQQIIVYRNPLEYALWNGGFPDLIPCLAGAAVFLAVVVGLTKIYDPNFRKHGDLFSRLYLLAGALAGIGVAWYTWV
jgi:hypothetical protein